MCPAPFERVPLGCEVGDNLVGSDLVSGGFVRSGLIRRSLVRSGLIGGSLFRSGFISCGFPISGLRSPISVVLIDRLLAQRLFQKGIS